MTDARLPALAKAASWAGGAAMACAVGLGLVIALAPSWWPGTDGMWSVSDGVWGLVYPAAEFSAVRMALLLAPWVALSGTGILLLAVGHRRGVPATYGLAALATSMPFLAAIALGAMREALLFALPLLVAASGAWGLALAGLRGALRSPPRNGPTWKCQACTRTYGAVPGLAWATSCPQHPLRSPTGGLLRFVWGALPSPRGGRGVARVVRWLALPAGWVVVGLVADVVVFLDDGNPLGNRSGFFRLLDAGDIWGMLPLCLGVLALALGTVMAYNAYVRAAPGVSWACARPSRRGRLGGFGWATRGGGMTASTATN